MGDPNFDYGKDYGDRLQEVMDRLKEHYGVSERPKVKDPVGFAVKTILSQNTNDENRDVAKERFDERFESYQEVLDAPMEDLVNAVRPAGLGPTKAERIKKFLQRIREEQGEFTLEHVRNMDKEEAKNYLTDFPGIGPKSAAVMLCFVFEKPVIPVDTHVHRVSKRLKLIPDSATRKKAHEILEREVPDDRMYEFHINLIKHGRKVCTARNPDCQESFLADLCVNCPCQEN